MLFKKVLRDEGLRVQATGNEYDSVHTYINVERDLETFVWCSYCKVVCH